MGLVRHPISHLQSVMTDMSQEYNLETQIKVRKPQQGVRNKRKMGAQLTAQPIKSVQISPFKQVEPVCEFSMATRRRLNTEAKEGKQLFIESLELDFNEDFS